MLEFRIIKIEALEHHINNMKWEIPGRSPSVGEIKKFVRQRTTRLSKLRTQEGIPVYPALQTSKGRGEYNKCYLQIVEAVKSGNFSVIHDFGPNGDPNFDKLCNLCGNREGNRCVKKDQAYSN